MNVRRVLCLTAIAVALISFVSSNPIPFLAVGVVLLAVAALIKET